MRTLIGLLLSLCAVLPAQAQTESNYPSKLVKIIIPFPAGSGMDATGRFIAQKIAQQTGQSIVVENMGGANGVLAAQAASRAAPDGYTVFLTGATTQVINPHLIKKLPYDPIKDFTPVSKISEQPMALVVRASNEQIKTVDDLTAQAKKTPGKLTFAAGNAAGRMAAELYKEVANVDLLHIPYKGIPQGLTDVMSGQVDIMFPDLATAVPKVKNGSLRALAVTGTKRVASLPEVPTMAEAKIPGFDLQTWVAAYVPAKTPKPVIDRLNELIRVALSSEEAATFFGRTGNTPTPSTPAELEAFSKAEYEKWGRIARIAGIVKE